MSSPQELKVTERDTTLTPRQLRKAGFIPATLYAHGGQSKTLQVRAHEFNLFYAQGIREFKLTGFTDCIAKARQVQMDAVYQKPLAIEFMPMDGAADKKAKKPAKQQEKPAKAQEAALPAEEVDVAEPALTP